MIHEKPMANIVSLKRKLSTESVSDIRRAYERKASISSGNALSTKTSPNNTQLCASCIAIDFEQILSSRIRRNLGGHPVAELKGDPREWERSQCPLCQFFAVVRPHPSSDGAVEEYVLCAFRTDGRLWNYPDECILLAVLRKNDRKGRSASAQVLKSTQSTGFICSTNPPSFRDSSKTMRGRLIEPESINFDLLRRWLMSCEDSHQKTCNNEAAYSVNSLKVIDCITRKFEPAPLKCKYVALSYVWGQPKRGDAEVLHGTSLPEQVPRTIEDSIAVTKALRLRYLWLDRYCIPQNDAKERDSNIRQMDLIYSGAHLTIVAAAGQDPDFGLPGVSSTQRIPQARVQISNHTLCSTMEDPTSVIKHSKWMSRAWTFQEALFSRRRLIFTEQQVFYECKATNWSETVDFERSSRSGKIFHTEFDPRRPSVIFDLIKSYSGRMLTYDHDALNGFLGVFRAFEAEKEPVYHYWGVPVLPPVIRKPYEFVDPVIRETREGFHIGLCWLSNKPGRRRVGFPSWSWAGWTSEVYYLADVYWYGLMEHAGLALDISVELNSGDSKDWDSFWQSHRFDANDTGQSKFLHFESWTIPLHLGTATHDPTMVGQSDSRTWSNPPHPEKGSDMRLTIKFYSTSQNDEACSLDTKLEVHSLVGIILGDFRTRYDRPYLTFVLVAQETEYGYECVGHMIFQFTGLFMDKVKDSRDWVLDVPDMAYPFRNKSVRRIRLG